MSVAGSTGPGANRRAIHGTPADSSSGQDTRSDVPAARPALPGPLAAIATGNSGDSEGVTFSLRNEAPDTPSSNTKMTLAQARGLITKIKNMAPEEQVVPLTEFARLIPDIDEDNRGVALRLLCNQTMLIAERGVDCAPILARIPDAARSLRLHELREGYWVARMGMSSESVRTKMRANGENYGEYLFGMALLLRDVASVPPTDPGEEPIVPYAEELTLIFAYLDKIPVENHFDAVLWLCMGRGYFTPDASDLVIGHALQAMASGRFTVRQQKEIVHDGLIAGIPSDNRVDRELPEIYLASLDTNQDLETRISLLRGLLRYADHACLTHEKEKVENALNAAYEELDKAPSEADDAVDVVQEPADIPSVEDIPSFIKASFIKANWHASNFNDAFARLATASIDKRTDMIASLAATRFDFLPDATATITGQALADVANVEFDASQRLTIAAALVQGLKPITPSDKRFLSEVELMHHVFRDQPTVLSMGMLSGLAEFLQQIQLTEAGKWIRNEIEADALARGKVVLGPHE